MRRLRAFTLLETIIALGVAVVVLGATVAARRATLQNSQVSESQSIMDSLVNDSLNKVRLTHETNPASFAIALTGLAGGITTGTEYAVPYVPSTIANGNFQLDWCTYPDVKAACAAVSTTVKGSAWVTRDLMTNIFTAVGATKAEIVAIKRTDLPGSFQVIDEATYDKVTNASNSAIATGTVGYDFYNRQVKIVTNKEDLSGPSPSPTYSVTGKKYVYYTATVTVWPYGQNVTTGVSRSITFADSSAAIQ